MPPSIAWKQIYLGMRTRQKSDRAAFNRIVEPMVDGILGSNAAYALALPNEKLEIRGRALNAVKEKLENNSDMARERKRIKDTALVFCGISACAAFFAGLARQAGAEFAGLTEMLAGAFFVVTTIFGLKFFRKMRATAPNDDRKKAKDTSWIICGFFAYASLAAGIAYAAGAEIANYAGMLLGAFVAGTLAFGLRAFRELGKNREEFRLFANELETAINDAANAP